MEADTFVRYTDTLHITLWIFAVALCFHSLLIIFLAYRRRDDGKNTTNAKGRKPWCIFSVQ